jgi:transcriptional regulator with XRE-family HTH domain
MGVHADGTRPRAFAQRMRSLMEEQGLSVAELTKRMEQELPGEKFNPVNLSHYKAGRSMPRPRYLSALSRAFGVEPKELIPPGESPDAGESENAGGRQHAAPAVRIEDLSDGQAWLQINQKLPWPLVLRILDALKGEQQDDVEPTPSASSASL